MGILDKIFNRNKKKKEYHNNGNIKLEYELNYNKNKNGYYKEYYENGKIKFSTNFLDNIQNGKSKCYNQKGQLIRESFLKEGKHIDGIKEFYNDGNLKFKIDFLINNDKERCSEITFFNIDGEASFSLSLKEIFNESENKSLEKPVYSPNLWEFVEGEKFSPNGIWKIFNDSNNVVFEIDFISTTPDFTLSFDYNYCELRKFDIDGKLISRKVMRISKINFDYFSYNAEHIFDRPNKEKAIPPSLIGEIIELEEYVSMNQLNIVNQKTSKNFSKIKNNPDWIRGFDKIYQLPAKGNLDHYIPFYDQGDEESYRHPTSRMKISYNSQKIQISAITEIDICKIINEIMLSYGGVETFKVSKEIQDPIEAEWINFIIKIQKYKSKKSYMKIDKKSNQLINCTEDDDYDVEFSIGAVIIWLLPPKNPSSRPIYFEINQRGIHHYSDKINTLFPGLNKSVLCFCEGGVADGRLFVAHDNSSADIINAFYEKEDANIMIEVFKNIIKSFSISNEIVKMNAKEIVLKLDEYSDDFMSSNNNLSIPSDNFNKDYAGICFSINDNILVSLYKTLNIYILRIDNKTGKSWEKLNFNKNIKMKYNFYINDKS